MGIHPQRRLITVGQATSCTGLRTSTLHCPQLATAECALARATHQSTHRRRSQPAHVPALFPRGNRRHPLTAHSKNAVSTNGERSRCHSEDSEQSCAGRHSTIAIDWRSPEPTHCQGQQDSHGRVDLVSKTSSVHQIFWRPPDLHRANGFSVVAGQKFFTTG